MWGLLETWALSMPSSEGILEGSCSSFLGLQRNYSEKLPHEAYRILTVQIKLNGKKYSPIVGTIENLDAVVVILNTRNRWAQLPL